MNPKEKERVLGPSRNTLGNSTGTSPSGKANQLTSHAFKKDECPEGNALATGIRLSALVIKKEVANSGICVHSRKEVNTFCGSRPHIGCHPSRRGNDFAQIQSEGGASAWCSSHSREIDFT